MTPLYEAVIFDIDGVLADSEPVYNAAMQSVLTPLGHTVMEEHQRAMMGLGPEDTWRYLCDAFDIHGSIAAVVDAYSDELLIQLTRVHETLPGVRALIDALRQRNVPIAVASSSPARLDRRPPQRPSAWVPHSTP